MTSWWPVAFAALAACAGGSGGKERTHDFDNVGRVCVCSPDDLPFCEEQQQIFAANQPVTIKFSVPTVCLSSSCSLDPEASCEVTRNGSTFVVSTAASYTDLSGQNRACTDDCGRLGATCQTGPLPAGDYTFAYGGQTIALTIPSQVPAPCGDNGPPSGAP